MKNSTRKTYGVIIIGLIVALIVITAFLVCRKVLAARATSNEEATTTEYSADSGTVNETTEVVTLAETSGAPVEEANLDEEEQEWIENMTFNLDSVEEGVIPYLESLGFTISPDGLSYTVPTNKDGFPLYNDQRVRAARELDLYNGVISDAPGWPLVFNKEEWSEKDWEEKVWRRIKYRGITKIEDTIAAAEMLADAPSISGKITFKEIPGNEWIVDFINDSAAARKLPLDEHPRGLEIWTATGRDGICYNNEEFLVRAVAVWQAWDTYLRSSKVDYSTPIVNWRGLAENTIASNTHLVQADYLEKNRPFIVLFKYDKNGNIYDKVGWNLLDGGCARFSLARPRSNRTTTTTTTTTTTNQQQTTTNTDTSTDTSTDIVPDENKDDNPDHSDNNQPTKNSTEDPVQQGNAQTGGGYNDDKGPGPDHGDQGNSQSSTVQGSQFTSNETQHDDTSKDTAEATQAAKEAEQQAAQTGGANIDDQNPNKDAGTNVSEQVTIPTHTDSHDDNSNTSGNDAGDASVNNDTDWSMD